MIPRNESSWRDLHEDSLARHLELHVLRNLRDVREWASGSRIGFHHGCDGFVEIGGDFHVAFDHDTSKFAVGVACLDQESHPRIPLGVYDLLARCVGSKFDCQVVVQGVEHGNRVRIAFGSVRYEGHGVTFAEIRPDLLLGHSDIVFAGHEHVRLVRASELIQDQQDRAVFD